MGREEWLLPVRDGMESDGFFFFFPANILTFEDPERKTHGDQEHLELFWFLKKKKNNGT